MKRGAKPQLPAIKAARGTLRKDRDGAKPLVGQVVGQGEPPITPDYLTAEARNIWLEELGRVMCGGVGELDSSLFARYCSLEALARKAFKSGEPPPAAYLTELRRMAELLGIAGPRVRQGQKQGSTPADNPFARNGRR